LSMVSLIGDFLTICFPCSIIWSAQCCTESLPLSARSTDAESKQG
jgi:hypothetical protein